MTLNPTLKSILVRTLYIVVSPIAYWVLYRVLFLIWPSLEMHTTIDGVWMFAVALAIIWFNDDRDIFVCICRAYILV